jgi:hypothetical protein
MTEFAHDLRHYCRNPRCRSKLPSPVSNPREAFCTRGCYESFHLKRCRVCEQPLEAKYRKIKNGGDRTKFVRVQNSAQTCGAAECKRRWRERDGTGRFSAPKQASGYPGSQNLDLHQEVPISCGSNSAIQTAKNARTAIVPDGPDCAWEGGEYRRLQARDRARLREHFRKLADQCLIQPHHSPVNILGGYRFPNAPAVDLSPLPSIDDRPIPSDWKPCVPSALIVGDHSVPDFLRRLPDSPMRSFSEAAE